MSGGNGEEKCCDKSREEGFDEEMREIPWLEKVKREKRKMNELHKGEIRIGCKLGFRKIYSFTCNGCGSGIHKKLNHYPYPTIYTFIYPYMVIHLTQIWKELSESIFYFLGFMGSNGLNSCAEPYYYDIKLDYLSMTL